MKSNKIMKKVVYKSEIKKLKKLSELNFELRVERSKKLQLAIEESNKGKPFIFDEPEVPYFSIWLFVTGEFLEDIDEWESEETHRQNVLKRYLWDFESIKTHQDAAKWVEDRGFKLP